jgi:ligand-binding sensor protein/AraC-like DNA-binding protein
VQNKFLHLDYIINVNNFQKIQDSIAEATEMAMLTVDYKGTPITNHSRCSDFCKTVRAHPHYSQFCEKCDSRGGLEATRLQKPYIYICHMGVLDLAIPIIVDGQYIGAVMAGQVLIKDDLEKESLEKIVNNKYNEVDHDSNRQLEELFTKLPVMTLDRVKAVASMMFHISNYIVEEALLKINLNEMSHIDFQGEKLNTTDTPEIYKVELLNHNTNMDFNDVRIISQNKENKMLYKNNIILRPALEYIQINYSRAITLDEMASLCNISTSYFSKLFKKALGDKFANYINKVRVKRAKELLETTDMPILNISLDLGFEDCGYFIKVFKKLEGVTPAVYRNEYNLRRY